MEKKKQFKVVLKLDGNTYEVWHTNDEGEWECYDSTDTYTRAGEISKETSLEWGLVSERILWTIDHLNSLGYEFIGITRG